MGRTNGCFNIFDGNTSVDDLTEGLQNMMNRLMEKEEKQKNLNFNYYLILHLYLTSFILQFQAFYLSFKYK